MTSGIQGTKLAVVNRLSRQAERDLIGSVVASDSGAGQRDATPRLAVGQGSLVKAYSTLPDLCSVIMFLVKNSLEAGARHIQVNWDQDLVVQDNGKGISVQLLGLLGHWLQGNKGRSWAALAQVAEQIQVRSGAWKACFIDGKQCALGIDTFLNGTRVYLKGLFHRVQSLT